MARVQIQMPEAILFTTTLTVRVADINYGGHVGNDTMLSLMQEARTQLYRSLGYTNELSFEGTVGQVVADASVVYKAETFLGDVLSIYIAVGEFSRYGFDLFYRVTKDKETIEVAIGKTGIVCFDYAIKKVARVPESLRTKLEDLR